MRFFVHFCRDPAADEVFEEGICFVPQFLKRTTIRFKHFAIMLPEAIVCTEWDYGFFTLEDGFAQYVSLDDVDLFVHCASVGTS